MNNYLLKPPSDAKFCREISHVLEVTESRISQLHTKALQKMKTKMGIYMGFLTGN